MNFYFFRPEICVEDTFARKSHNADLDALFDEFKSGVVTEESRTAANEYFLQIHFTHSFIS